MGASCGVRKKGESAMDRPWKDIGEGEWESRAPPGGSALRHRRVAGPTLWVWGHRVERMAFLRRQKTTEPWAVLRAALSCCCPAARGGGLARGGRGGKGGTGGQGLDGGGRSDRAADLGQGIIVAVSTPQSLVLGRFASAPLPCLPTVVWGPEAAPQQPSVHIEQNS